MPLPSGVTQQMVRHLLRDTKELLSAAERADRSWAKGEFERRREMAPELFDVDVRPFPAQ